MGQHYHGKLFYRKVPISRELTTRGGGSIKWASDGFGVLIRSVERYDLVKIKQRGRKQIFRLRLRFRGLRSSKNQIVGVVSINFVPGEPCSSTIKLV